MISRPATPRSELPVTHEDRRFKTISAVCEWAEDYRPGGRHPVALGDTFYDGKYKVIRKLGEGSFSTVWLAFSKSTPRYVAIKIMTAKSSALSTELNILKHLAKAAHGGAYSGQIVQLLDEFLHSGPNGVHQCLVFEPMGTTAASLVEELPENKPKMWDSPQRYPKWLAKKILQHTLQGLSFLHETGVVHGDIQPGNLLFPITNIDGVEQQQLEQDETETAIPLLRNDGKEDRWAPAKLYLKQSLYDHVQLGPDLRIKISDFGAAFFATSPPTKTVTPLALRAPEIILEQTPGSGIDIWSFGCLMFEFLTGEVLFGVMRWGKKQENLDDADDDHLLQLHITIRPLSNSIKNDWSRARKYIDPDGKLIQNDDSEHLGEEEIDIGACDDGLEQRFQTNKHPDIDDEEATTICQLIRHILVYDPAKRPSAAELLEHPWFSS